MKKRPTLWLRIAIPTVLISLWLGVSAIGGPYFGRIDEVSDIDLTAFLPKSAEATKVNNELGRFRSDATLPAVVVFESKSDVITDAQLEKVTNATSSLSKVAGIKGDISPPIQSDNKKAAFVVLPVDSSVKIPEALQGVRDSLSKKDIGDTQYKITGPAGFAADLNKAFAGIDGVLLLTALAVVFVILVIVYRSALLPIVVLLTSIFALSASILLVFYLAKIDLIQLNGQVQGILFILVIGAATDYSLLYVSRYREELYKHSSKLAATLNALKGAFEPILASGGTVIVGLLCLLLSDLASNKALGPVGAIGIVFAMLAALTFLPAALYALGRTSFWPVRPLATKKSQAVHKQKLQKGFWHRVGEVVDGYPRRVWVITAIVLVVFAYFVTQIRAVGVAQSDLIVGASEARDGQKILSEYFPDGSGSPALIIANSDTYEKVVQKVDAVPGVDGVVAVATGVDAGFAPLGKQQEKITSDIRKEAERKLADQQKQIDEQMAAIEAQAGLFAAEQARLQIESAVPPVDQLVADIYPFKDAVIKKENNEVLLQATLSDAPDSEAAKHTVERLRTAVRTVDATAKVGGTTAVQLDTNNASIRDRMIIIPVVLLAITSILMLLLRSIIAPLLLLITTVISFAASLGVAALLFNHVWHFPGADPSVVLYAFVFLVALGIDYNIFLMTRVREETVKDGTAKGVINGLVVTGGVITSAGIVLAATFAALGVIPILFLFQLAFIVAFGVLLDTFVVRSLLVPALIRDIGSFVWWPSKLKNRQ